MRVALRLIVVGIVSLLGVACSQEAIYEAITSPEERELSLRIIRALHVGDGDKIGALAKPEVAEKLLPLVPKMRTLLPLRFDHEPRLVDGGVTIASPDGGKTVRLSHLAYAIDEGDRHALIRLGFEKSEDKVWLIGLRVNALPRPVEEITAFALSEKPLGHYVFLAFAFLATATIVVSLVVLYRARNVRRKWLWALGCVVGLGQFTMEWSTGTVNFNLLAVQAFGFVATKFGALASWQIGFGVPIVAYIFLLRQARLRMDRQVRSP